jgi:8-oxo-dGTP diphosphatase
MTGSVDPEGVITEGRYVRAGRACAAVLRVGLFGLEILMVRHRDFWTLPGGGIEPGEDPSAAAARELLEETGLRGTPLRELFPGCWEVEVDPAAPISIGADPELVGDTQVLRGVAWFTLDEKHDDRHVSQVIAALGRAGRLSPDG